MEEISIISSIPGRIRLRVKPLKQSPEACISKMAGRLLEIKGMISIAPNDSTGSVLMVFHPAVANQTILDTAVEMLAQKNQAPFCLTKETASPPLATKPDFAGKGLANRLFKFSLLTATAVYFSTRSLARAASILLWGHPGAIFSINRSASRYTAQAAAKRDIILMDPAKTAALSEVKRLYLDERLSGGRDMEHMIKALRRLGINPIAVPLSHSGNQKDEPALPAEPALILISHATWEGFEGLLHELKSTPAASDPLIAVVGLKLVKKTNVPDMYIPEHKLSSLPWLISLSKYREQLVIRYQAAAAAIGVGAMALISLGYLSFLGSFMVFLVNIGILNQMLQHHILKELTTNES